jgi:hypothetical protein
MAYQIPTPPAAGVVVDAHGLTWRRSSQDAWDPSACGTCGSQPAGGLSWCALLEQRGPLTDAT